VLAGLAVGIGVPILLFYVYGVVPVSLCRSGGCGVSTSGAGVRFDFDDENDLLGVLGARNTGKISLVYILYIDRNTLKVIILIKDFVIHLLFVCVVIICS
jgi:hypothetical protein